MAMQKGKGPGPAPLEPKVIKKLLDKLSTDNEFRRLFKKDATAALAKVGCKPPKGPPFPPPGPPEQIPPTCGQCMQMKSMDRIASKAQITRDRAKLEKSLNAIQNFTNAKAFTAD